MQKSITTYIQTFSKLLSFSRKDSWKDTLTKDFHTEKKTCHVLNHFCSQALVQGPYYYYKQYCKYYYFRKMDKIGLNPGYLINGLLNNQVTRRKYCSNCSYISTEDVYNLCAIKCPDIFFK